MKKAVGIILMNLINVERNNIGLSPINYNFELHNYLKNNVTNNGSYFYESTELSKSWIIEGHNRSCDLRGCFMKPLEQNYMLRDTMRNSIVKIFRYRLAQKDCKHTDFVDNMPCSWFYHYYPIMMSNYTSFTCKILDYQGRFVPDLLKDRQLKSFWCFFDGFLPWFK